MWVARRTKVDNVGEALKTVSVGNCTITVITVILIASIANVLCADNAPVSLIHI